MHAFFSFWFSLNQGSFQQIPRVLTIAFPLCPPKFFKHFKFRAIHFETHQLTFGAISNSRDRTIVCFDGHLIAHRCELCLTSKLNYSREFPAFKGPLPRSRNYVNGNSKNKLLSSSVLTISAEVDLSTQYPA